MEEAALSTLSKRVLDAAFAVHTELGPGLLKRHTRHVSSLKREPEACMSQLKIRFLLSVEAKSLPISASESTLLVENELIIEIKAIETIAPVHKAQLLSYFRLSKRRLGLLINFNVGSLRDGIVR